ncbi:MAG: hypothetical protein AB1730_06570 [Myxococcota bacterium]|jgi:hypothetical protein
MGRTSVSAGEVLRRVVRRVAYGPVFDSAAQVAFSAVLALAPFLVVLASLAASCPTRTPVARLLSRAEACLPPEAYRLAMPSCLREGAPSSRRRRGPASGPRGRPQTVGADPRRV